MQTVDRVNCDLTDPQNVRDPYPLYAQLRKMGPCWNDTLGGWCLSSFESVSRGLVDPELLASRFTPYLERAAAKAETDRQEIELYEGLCRWFNFTDPPYHTKLRLLTQKVVTRPISQARPVTEQLVDERLDDAALNGGIDVVTELARPVALGTVVSIMGVPPADFPQFTKWSKMMSTFIGGALNVPDRREQALEAQKAMDKYFESMIAERRKNPSDDFISNMLAVEHPELGRFTDAEITATSAMMLFAGHGTTTHAIGNLVLALLTHPEQLQLMRNDPTLVRAALEEALRWDSPVHLIARVAGRDGVAGIEDARKGDRVFLLLASSNRDPANGENYEKFDITRKDGGHNTFGTGIHTCLGAALARMEASVLLTKLLARFKRIELGVEPHELQWESAIGFRSLSALPIRVA